MAMGTENGNSSGRSGSEKNCGDDAAGAEPRPGRFPWGLVPSVCALVTVLSIALFLLPERLLHVRYQFDVGGADSAAYALQARSLARGNGLEIPYVTNYLYVYSRDIWRRDDHWPPLLSFVQAAAFRIWGVDGNIALMTTVFIATVLLPVCFCALVIAATGRAWLGVPATLPLFWSAGMMQEAQRGLSDQLLTAVLCLFLAGLLLSRKHRAWLLLCGLTMALAWYGKGSQIILFGFLAGGVALLHGPRALLGRAHLGAVLLALVLLFPRLHYNARHFGDPLHSTQSFVSSFYGLTDFDGMFFQFGFYSIHWGRELPGPRNRFRHPNLHSRSMRRNTEVFLRPYLLGLDAAPGDWESLGSYPESFFRELTATGRVRFLREVAARAEGEFAPLRDWPNPWATLFHLSGAVWGMVAIFLAPLLWLSALVRRKPLRGDSVTAATGVIGVFVLMQALFVIVFWNAALWNDSLRLTYPALVPAYALGWCLVAVLLGRAGGMAGAMTRYRPPAWVLPLLTGVFCFVVWSGFMARADDLMARQEAALPQPPPTRPAYPRAKELADRMAETLPEDTVFMARGRGPLWFAPETFRSVGLPYARPGDVMAVARYYGVTHLVQNWPHMRDLGLNGFIRRNQEAFETVISRPYRVYRIHYDRLSPEQITPLNRVEPAWDPATALQGREAALSR